jgi:hypothetical protein
MLLRTNDASHRVIPADALQQRVSLSLPAPLAQEAVTGPFPPIGAGASARQLTGADDPASAARPVGRRKLSRERHKIRFLAFGAIGGASLAGPALQHVLVPALLGGPVAGGRHSVDDTFWGRFADRNRRAAKTPGSDVHTWSRQRTSADEAVSHRSLPGNDVTCRGREIRTA